jgi:hypothetical protein
MNTPKAVADELLALARDKDEIKKALVESGAEVGEDDGFSSFPEKIRGLNRAAPLKIFKSMQFYQWIDEALPPLRIDDGYSNPNLTWFLGRCPNLIQIPPIEGLERAVNMESFINESKMIKKLVLPDMPNLTSAKQIAQTATALEAVEIGDMPQVTILYLAFSQCSSLKTVSLGDAPRVSNVFALFHQCPSLTRVTLSFSGGLISDAQHMFSGCSSLEEVNGVIHLSDGANVSNIISGCINLREIRIKGISRDLVFFEPPNLSLESARYLINEARTVTGKTIYLPQKLVDDHEDEMVKLGEIASAKGWSLNYR